MSDFLSWLVLATWQGAVLIAIVLVLRFVLRNRLSASWRSALWLIVLLRLALPIAPSAGFSIFNVTPNIDSHAQVILAEPNVREPLRMHSPQHGPEPLTMLQPSQTQISTATKKGSAQRLTDIFTPASAFSIWLLGAVGVLVTIAFTAGRVLELLRQSVPLARPDVDALVRSCASELKWRGTLRIMESPNFESPAVVGWLRPCLVLPEGLVDRLSNQDLRAVILHELAHIKRGDVPLSWVASAVLMLHWFNPLAWLAVWCMRRDRELACDELALEATPLEDRLAYGETLIKLLSGAKKGSALPGVAAIVEDCSGVQRRMAMITGFRPKGVLATVVSATLCGVLCLATLTNASPPDAAKQTAVDTEKSLEFYLQAYLPHSEDLVKLSKGLSWHVQAKYLGAGINHEHTVDDRLTVVLNDAANSFWPVIMKLSDKEAEKLVSELQTAVTNRKGDLQTQPSKCAEEPKTLELELSKERLKPGQFGMSPYTKGRWSIQPLMADMPHMPVEITWLMESPDSPMLNVGHVRMSVTDAENLISRVQAVSRARAADAAAPVSAPAEDDADIRLYTQGLKLNEWGAADLPAGTVMKAYAFYRGTDEAGKEVIDDRLTVVLADTTSRMWHMVARLSDAQGQQFVENLRNAIESREGESPKGVSSIIATKPYKIGTHGMVQLPANVSLMAYSRYNGVDEDGNKFTDNRVTVVANDEANSFWGMVVKLDEAAAAELARSIEASLDVRKKGHLPPEVRRRSGN